MSTDARTPVHGSAFGCITLPFLLLALVPLAWGARARWNDGQLLRSGEVAPGRVVELRYVESHTSVGQTVRGGQARGESPVVTFTTRAGDARTVLGSVNRHPAPWAVGDMVDVVYDPVDPARADLRTEVEGWRSGFAIWCAVGAVLIAIALLPLALLVRDRRVQRPTPV